MLACRLTAPLDLRVKISIFQNAKFAVLAFVIVLALTCPASGGIAGIAVYGVCQTGCNAAWVACVAAAGGTAGVTTGGLGVPAAILACNAAQGVCMGACAALALSPV